MTISGRVASKTRALRFVIGYEKFIKGYIEIKSTDLFVTSTTNKIYI